ncbi:MAG: response regulator [Leptolyngbyaceae cyanobacterium SM2_5_2]|nr:response regulator [Leptolyngbyaceae cyanobacterium SM2_5_2]
MASPTPQPTLHVLSLLAQVSSRQVSGCLKVTTPTNHWLLFLEQGALNYATTTERAFDRLDAHLRRLSLQVPGLVSALRVQVRLLFEQQPFSNSGTVNCPDYQAICWLVEQHHLPITQATSLIETMSKDVVEAFLAVREGNHELIEVSRLEPMPWYCHLNLRTTVEECYGRMQQRRNNGAATLSQRGNGAIPAGRSVAVAEPVMSQPTGLDANPVKSAAKTHYTIACIDDSPTVLRAINEFLDDKMFSVVMIEDPVKALMQVIRNKPDLILLDVTMPNLDGYELCSLLRRHPDFKNTPIIMVTSNTGLIDRAKAKLVRASGYLTKPFSQSDLLKFIFKYLN